MRIGGSRYWDWGRCRGKEYDRKGRKIKDKQQSSSDKERYTEQGKEEPGGGKVIKRCRGKLCVVPFLLLASPAVMSLRLQLDPDPDMCKRHCCSGLQRWRETPRISSSLKHIALSQNNWKYEYVLQVLMGERGRGREREKERDKQRQTEIRILSRFYTFLLTSIVKHCLQFKIDHLIGKILEWERLD